MCDEEIASFGKEDYEENEKFLDDLFVEGGSGWWKVYCETRYLPSGVFLSMVDDKEITYFPKEYIDIVKACYELAIYLRDKKDKMENITKTVDAYFFNRLSMSFQKKPEKSVFVTNIPWLRPFSD